MPVSRHSFRRVIGDIVNRQSTKTDGKNGFHRTNSRSNKKIDRNSLISNESISPSQTYYERLHKCEKEVHKSLSYLDQVLTHNKLEILANIITSIIENIFDIDSILKGIFEHQTESFRTNFLADVYSLLADLIEWSDKFLLSKQNTDDKYRKIAKDLMQAVKNCINASVQLRSSSFQSFQSLHSLDEPTFPTFPPKRDKRPVSSTASMLSNQSRTTTTTSSSQSFLANCSNDDRIQLIFDDINQIVENYTRELDDALHSTPSNTLTLTKKFFSTDEFQQKQQQQQDLPPPVPPKRHIARAYMSLFDRYDQNKAELFLRQTCFVSTPEQRFEDLFEQVHQHFPQMDLISTNDESTTKTQTNQDNLSIDRLISNDDLVNDLFLEDITHLLVFNLNEDPPLRGGSIEALIIRATSPDKKDFLYQEAFLTTYRTFISPNDLIEKLLQRYTFFVQFETKKKIARYAFSLLIRIIDEIDNELTENLMEKLSHFVTVLVRQGELQLGKLLRKKSLERFTKSHVNQNSSQQDIILIQNSISSKRASLLDFHASDISEQLTLVDSELFLKIQLSEILYMSIEKGEEYSPNLAAFTEHFNNISYWVRSRILEQNSPKQRENYFEKFLKILKHLRRLNNFNSYLAILSALDCGPIKRLNWSKNIADAIAEHTVLIDSTGSFKNYREALNASIGQPCIPYIGLVLSDLTFVHIGNSDCLQDNRIINFWKRWQQFTILHKFRYCRKWEYKFTRNDRILYFFNNFDDFMNEEAQWIQSEKIKPRQKAPIYA